MPANCQGSPKLSTSPNSAHECRPVSQQYALTPSPASATRLIDHRRLRHTAASRPAGFDTLDKSLATSVARPRSKIAQAIAKSALKVEKCPYPALPIARMRNGRATSDPPRPTTRPREAPRAFVVALGRADLSKLTSGDCARPSPFVTRLARQPGAYPLGPSPGGRRLKNPWASPGCRGRRCPIRLGQWPQSHPR